MMQQAYPDRGLYFQKFVVPDEEFFSLNEIGEDELLYMDSFLFFLLRTMLGTKLLDGFYKRECLTFLRNCIIKFMSTRTFNNPLISYSTFVDVLDKKTSFSYMYFPMDTSSGNMISQHLTEPMETLIGPICNKVVSKLSKFGDAMFRQIQSDSFVTSNPMSSTIRDMPNALTIEGDMEKGYF